MRNKNNCGSHVGKAVITTGLLLACTVTQATTIDFSEFSYPGTITTNEGETIASQGYDFSPSESGEEFFVIGEVISSPDAALAWGPSTALIFESSDGSAFNLLNVDLASTTSFDVDMIVTGYRAGSSTIETTFTINNIWSSFDFGNEWTNLARVEFSPISGSFGQAIDNIAVVPVPVPAAIWLFISGLIGIAGRARRLRQ